MATKTTARKRTPKNPAKAPGITLIARSNASVKTRTRRRNPAVTAAPAKRSIGKPKEFFYLVQAMKQNKWETVAGFYAEHSAADYAKHFHARNPDMPVRVMKD